ncbi:MAG: hypothetical protein R2737_03980 [Candidatus Nanopelagicales bacterium]
MTRRVAARDALPGRWDRGARAVAGDLAVVAELPLDDGLVLAVLVAEDGRRFAAPLVVGSPAWRRAVPGDGAAEALTRLLARAAQGEPGTGDDVTLVSWGARPVVGERPVDVDQTHESVVVGDAAVVKWAVELTPGPHPAPQRLAALVAAGFDAMPPPWGLVEWHDPDTGGAAVLLATVAGFLPEATDGWEWAVGDLRAAAADGRPLHGATAAPRVLGATTARLHLALSAEGAVPASPRWAQDLADASIGEARLALDEVDGMEGARLRARGEVLLRELAGLGDCAGTPLAPVHGDLHVGQVLRHRAADGGWAYAITDFDGNPVADPAERASPQPPARDVAGMLQSLDHVGRVVLRRTDGVDAAYVTAWIPAAQREFLSAYAATLDRSGRPELLDHRLLRPLRLLQEVREFRYAVHHLPHWRYVPDGALQDLIPLTDED